MLKTHSNGYIMVFLKQYRISIFLVFCAIVSVSNTIKNSLRLNKKNMFQNCGHLCSYIDLCNSGHYEENNYMQSLCNFMIEEISYLEDENEVSKIEGHYMNKFHRHDLNKHQVREKRSSKRTVIFESIFHFITHNIMLFGIA